MMRLERSVKQEGYAGSGHSEIESAKSTRARFALTNFESMTSSVSNSGRRQALWTRDTATKLAEVIHVIIPRVEKLYPR